MVCIFYFTVINSTYQSGDASSGNDEDILYQSDALFSAKLDNSQSHNTNKQNINSNTKNNNNTENNTNINKNNNDNNLNDNDSLSFNKLNVSDGITNSASSKNVNKINSKTKNKVSRRYNNKSVIVKSSAGKNSKQINSNVNGGTTITNSQPTANQNAVHIDEYKQQHQQQREVFYDKNSNWNGNDDMYNDRQMEYTNDDYVYSVDDIDSGN